MKKRFKAVVFDCGNVTNPYWFSIICYLFAKYAWICDKKSLSWRRARPDEVFAAIYGDGKTSLLRKLERGENSPDGIGAQLFRDSVCQRLRMSITPQEFDRIWNSMFLDYDPEMFLWLKDLRKAGYPLLMATNNNEIHLKFLRETYPEIFEQFERVIASNEIGLVKSDGKLFYDHVLVAARTLVKDIEYADMIYFDDVLNYVVEWQNCGGKAVWHHETVKSQYDSRIIGLEW